MFQVLLDATYAAIAGGPAVVLGVDTQDSAVQWIGALSFLMSPRTAHGFRFSALEVCGVDDENDSLASALSRGVHLACVPRSQYCSLAPASGRVLVEETDDVELGELGGRPHRLSAGAEVPVTPWSVLAWGIFEWGSSTDLERLDALAAEVTDAGLDPAVPCALHVVLNSAAEDALRRAATQVLLEHTPRGLSGASENLQRAVSATAAWNMGDDLTQVAAVLERVPPYSSLCDLALRSYLDLLAEEVDALSGCDPLPLPGAGRFALSEALVLRWLQVLDNHATMLTNPLRTIYVLRALDHLWRLGEDPPGGGETLDASRRLVEDVLPSDFPVADDLVRKVGPLSPRLLEDVLRPVISRHPMLVTHSLGAFPTRAVLLWLFPEKPSPDLAPSLLTAATWAHLISTSRVGWGLRDTFRLALLRSVTPQSLTGWPDPPSPSRRSEAVAVAIASGRMTGVLSKALLEIEPHLIPGAAAASWRISAVTETEADAADLALDLALARGDESPSFAPLLSLGRPPLPFRYNDRATVNQLSRRLSAASSLARIVDPRDFGPQLAARFQVAVIQAIVLAGVWDYEIVSFPNVLPLVPLVRVELEEVKRELSIVLRGLNRTDRHMFAFDLLYAWTSLQPSWPLATAAWCPPAAVQAQTSSGTSLVSDVLSWEKDFLADENLASGVNDLAEDLLTRYGVKLDVKVAYKELRKQAKSLFTEDGRFPRFPGVRR
jgi:hypothetical protein